MNLAKRPLLIPILLTLTLLTPVLPQAASTQEIRSGESLLRAMHDRYKTSWYNTLTFTQKSTTYNPDGTTKVETWYEAVLLPGKLRIDVGSPKDGNGYVLADGSVTILQNGQVTGTRPLVNMLLVLGFDVYRQEPETTIAVVKSQGYDLSKLREDTWDGHAVYVVGADKGDLQSRQFWVEKETMLFVRELEPSQSDPKKFDDIRFTDYRKVTGGWVAARVEVHVDGKMVFSEEYSDIQVNPKLDPAVFDPKQFSATHWEKQ
jgi:outer membrane lipoprotein-sorting protein